MSHKPNTISTIAIGLFAATTLLAGCSSTTSGTGLPTNGAGPGSSSDTGNLPTNGAPKVTHPLDTTKFQSNVCTVLSSNQMSALHITKPGRPGSNDAGPKCDWTVGLDSESAPGDLQTIGITATTNNPIGLSSLYQQKSSLAVFQPVPDIEGYPTVRYGQGDDTDIGACGLGVGVTDKLVYSITTVIKPGAGDPCGEVTKVATAVVKTLKGGS